MHIQQQEEEMMSVESNLLPLVVTVSVHGQALKVEFEFDLVNDDPASVAIEMVSELGIPQEKALEISEVMSGHVHRARIILEAKRRQHQLQQEEEYVLRKIRSLAFQIREQQQLWMLRPKQ